VSMCSALDDHKLTAQIFYSPAWWWPAIFKQDAQDRKYGLARIHWRSCFSTTSDHLLPWLDNRFSKEAATKCQLVGNCQRSDNSVAPLTHLIVPDHCTQLLITFQMR
jgi:hypothetical protein